VSVSSTGAPQNGQPEISASISGDGRYVAFSTSATNLAPGATNGQLHNYVHDRITGETSQVDVTTGGVSFLFGDEPSLSLAGNVVVFDGATQIPGPEGFSVRVLPNGPTFFVPEKVGFGLGFPAPSRFGLRVAGIWEASANSADEIQVVDLLDGKTTIASVNDLGIQGTEGSSAAQMTADGGAVTFLSNAPNLVPDDTNAEPDIFVRTLCEL
jgi:hypothetical protein